MKTIFLIGVNHKNMKIFKFNFSGKNGYTLVELMVAATLFIVFFSIATAGFIRAIRTQRGLNSVINLTSNAGLTLEQMAREIRTGYHFTVGQDSKIAFINYNKLPVVYRLNNNAIERSEDNGTTFYPLTSTDVKIEKLIFKVSQTLSSKDPWRISIFIQAKSLVTGTSLQSPIFFQTTISARTLPGEAPS
ncbi:hypothetical protein COY65_02455 [Candidatus Jorgensenbacteria bacterium CG_4_10_14_0_8_um_filter_39_13]|uniref:Type II secretion system protein J n=2 Tax=Candidatus Joergenseniibacteriota TaxID=1752739 RepID=A0A2M7RGA8_9BACT|nr:MAG: hypothetical protein COZ81_00630 [Candidatus Jorgensenbacteria bacterium CG_4_8_14_3_um_filter_38_10]PIY95724.1 MAG: hypothetical protein COY65_02455 [Candidatus Jorgensenbacteria bacterium CG_4_10_14_0_8_um_filter_39_13]PJA94873.1 MAG: hypothetical protein CO130_02235 [Candidatus Jorgensenbacteria bacterium CG_4_9_14_3_um_filter_38_10]